MKKSKKSVKKVARRKYTRRAIVLAPTAPAAEPFWEIGKCYIIRTVTYFQVGKLVALTPAEVVLEEAAWIADTERWYETLSTGKVREAEPFPSGKVLVNRSAIVDACEWTHALIRAQV